MAGVTYRPGQGNSYNNTGNFTRYAGYTPDWVLMNDPIDIDPSILMDLSQNANQNGGIRGWFDKTVNNYKNRYQARRAPGGMFYNAGNAPAANTQALVPVNGAASTGAPANSSLLNTLKSNVGWNSKSGLSLMGHNVGKAVPYVAGGIAGIQALQGLDDLSKNRSTTEDLVNDILLSASGNPNTVFDLTADQRSLLRKLKRDGDASDADIGDIDLFNILKGAGTGIAGGALGGIPGMVVGGIGGALNAGINDVNSSQVANQAELEALLEALTMSEMNYKNALRQRAYANM